MADEDQQRPSLEPPSLFGRKKKRSSDRRPTPPPASAARSRRPAPATESPESGPPPSTPATEPAITAADTPADAPAAKAAAPAVVEQRPAARATTGEDGRVFADAGVDVASPESTQVMTTPPVVTQAGPRRARVDLTGRVGALVVGLAAGVALTAIVALGFRACASFGSSTSCGTGPGFALLLVAFAAAVVVGRVGLGRASVEDPGSTSFLAVGLVAVIALLFFVDVLDTWPMLLVVPVTTALSFLASWWVTTSFVEPRES